MTAEAPCEPWGTRAGMWGGGVTRLPGATPEAVWGSPGPEPGRRGSSGAGPGVGIVNRAVQYHSTLQFPELLAYCWSQAREGFSTGAACAISGARISATEQDQQRWPGTQKEVG